MLYERAGASSVEAECLAATTSSGAHAVHSALDRPTVAQTAAAV